MKGFWTYDVVGSTTILFRIPGVVLLVFVVAIALY